MRALCNEVPYSHELSGLQQYSNTLYHFFFFFFFAEKISRYSSYLQLRVSLLQRNNEPQLDVLS